MTTTMILPRTKPLQATSILAQQTTAQPTTGIDISTVMNLMLPVMVIGMMVKMISVTSNKKKQVQSPSLESTISHAKKTKKSG
jgi:hypothetical protein